MTNFLCARRSESYSGRSRLHLIQFQRGRLTNFVLCIPRRTLFPSFAVHEQMGIQCRRSSTAWSSIALVRPPSRLLRLNWRPSEIGSLRYHLPPVDGDELGVDTPARGLRGSRKICRDVCLYAFVRSCTSSSTGDTSDLASLRISGSESFRRLCIPC